MNTKDKKYFDLAKHKSLTINDKWYIVNKDWYDKWQKVANSNFPKNNMGKIDNCRLLNDNNEVNTKHLLNNNYELVPEEVWRYLVTQYGVDFDDEKAFQRLVIESHNNCIVEIQPLNLTLSIYGKENEVTMKFSRSKSLRDVYDFVTDKFAVKKPLRILQKMDNGSFDIVQLEETVLLGDAGFSNDEHLFIDTQDTTAQWTMKEARNRSSGAGKGFQLVSKLNDGRVLGVCGLCNLGNTCFMNSALQCISNVPPLTYYFIKTNWRSDLNVTNPLGMHGRLAERYFQLLEQIWVKGATYTVPRDFKVEVAKFAPQFSGYAQHDSQELMMFLLDGLHEDLNRIQKKPYMESSDDDKMPIIKKADEAWRYHRMRNDSCIVENFHGLLKSTVVCPDCNYVSITFDPFASLSLPLVVTYPQPFVIRMHDASQPLYSASVLVSKTETIKDFKEQVLDLFKLTNCELMVTEVHNSRMVRDYRNGDSVHVLKELEKVMVHEVPRREDDGEKAGNGRGEEWVELVMRCSSHSSATGSGGSSGSGSGSAFGLPSLVSVSTSDIDWYSLKTRIFSRLPYMGRILTSPSSATANNHQHKMHAASDTLLNPKQVTMEFEKMSQFVSILLRVKHAKDVYLPLMPDTPRKTLQAQVIYEVMLDWTPEGREKYYDEAVDIPLNHESSSLKSSGLNLQACVAEFVKKEKLGINDLWYCKMCREQKAATKKFDLWQLPRVLILHLKRFRSGYYRRDKIDTFVEYPISGLDLTKVVEDAHREVDDHSFRSGHEVYDLTAVSNHMGGLGGGHYTAYARNFIDNNWYLFDDSHTSKISADNIQTKSAYVLVYVSQSTLTDTRARLFTDFNGDSGNEMDVQE